MSSTSGWTSCASSARRVRHVHQLRGFRKSSESKRESADALEAISRTMLSATRFFASLRRFSASAACLASSASGSSSFFCSAIVSRLRLCEKSASAEAMGGKKRARGDGLGDEDGLVERFQRLFLFLRVGLVFARLL